MISGLDNSYFVAMMLHVCWLLIWFDSKTLTDLDGHLSTKATRKRDSCLQFQIHFEIETLVRNS